MTRAHARHAAAEYSMPAVSSAGSIVEIHAASTMPFILLSALGAKSYSFSVRDVKSIHEDSFMPAQNQPLRHEDKKAQKLIQKIVQRVAAKGKDEQSQQAPPRNQPQISFN